MLPRTEQETLCVQKKVPGEISEILRPFVFLSLPPQINQIIFMLKISRAPGRCGILAPCSGCSVGKGISWLQEANKHLMCVGKSCWAHPWHPPGQNLWSWLAGVPRMRDSIKGGARHRWHSLSLPQQQHQGNTTVFPIVWISLSFLVKIRRT